jgi:hypothetical protein
VHQSFVNYRNYRYGVLGGVTALATLVAYLLDSPRVPPNGGTVLGYTLGTLAALLVLFLSAFGIRKRAFHSRFGTAIGWVSAHVYLGLAALVVATLHSGMRFGWNVHTLAYVLMCFVTISGVWGMYAYIRYPGVMSAQRGNQQRRETLQQLAELDDRSTELAAATAQTQILIREAIRRTDLGGTGPWAALRARDQSVLVVGGESATRPARLVANPGQRALLQVVAQLLLTEADAQQRGRLQSLLELAGQKSVLLARLRRETQLATLLRIWLWIHVPVCCALLAALLAHVLTVFFYW